MIELSNLNITIILLIILFLIVMFMPSKKIKDLKEIVQALVNIL